MRGVQLLTGAVPFERDQGMAVLWRTCPSRRRRWLRRPDLPAAADQVLARALAKAPEDRYASCRDFADALREALGLAPYHRRSPVITPVHPPLSAPPARPGHGPDDDSALASGPPRRR